MYYLNMRPMEIREAVQKNLPVLIGTGSVEFHGEHLPIGTDGLIVESVIRRVQRRCECVVMPPLHYAPTMFWAAGAEDGEFDFSPDALEAYAKEVFAGLLRVGFRKVYIIIHHQGTDGLPAYTIKKAYGLARHELAKGQEPGWGRLPPGDIPEPKIFEIFRVACIDGFSDYEGAREAQCPIGHAGRGETQLMLADYEAYVKIEDYAKTTPLPEWLGDVPLASKEAGEYWIEFCADGWVKELTRQL